MRYIFFIVSFCFINLAYSQILQEKNAQVKENIIKLPEPQKEIGKPLMQALALRSSSRSFSTKNISLQQISNLLWAAYGINRNNGKRTAPSAHNWQEIDIYITTADGVFLYKAENHSLELIKEEDIREAAGVFEFVKNVPLNLIYVSDYSKMKGASETDEVKLIYTSADAGFIIQNVYLYCASEGLATVVFGGVNREVLARKMNLKDNQKIILAQSVGYPKE